jgi:hypothetical protein|tara:strand:- start:3049 stop:4002 length:954 start_codon:yes stop_codon:yes gene_type:complete
MITGTFNKIPKKKNSHGYGWARTWSENLGVGINHNGDYTEVLYLDHGVNFGGSLNLFSGFNDELKARIDNFLEAKVLYSLDIDMPDYGAMLKKRKDVIDKEWCDKVSEKCKTVKKLKSTDIVDIKWLTIGDSHTAAYSKENSMVIKTDGLTLNGQIKTDFEYVIQHIEECFPRGVTMSFGNIDIRHHICRLGVDSMEMLKAWKKFGDELEKKGIKVEYSTPWPIEFEERKLPKTGYYKGQPFWGTREERINALNQWITNMDKLGMKRVEYPEEWLTLNGEKFAKDKMESVSSVHLSPESYRRKNWGINCVQLSDFML